jgi:hypothetical protein
LTTGARVASVNTKVRKRADTSGELLILSFL